MLMALTRVARATFSLCQWSLFDSPFLKFHDLILHGVSRVFAEWRWGHYWLCWHLQATSFRSSWTEKSHNPGPCYFFILFNSRCPIKLCNRWEGKAQNLILILFLFRSHPVLVQQWKGQPQQWKMLQKGREDLQWLWHHNYGREVETVLTAQSLYEEYKRKTYLNQVHWKSTEGRSLDFPNGSITLIKT